MAEDSLNGLYTVNSSFKVLTVCCIQIRICIQLYIEIGVVLMHFEFNTCHLNYGNSTTSFCYKLSMQRCQDVHGWNFLLLTFYFF